ncbi:MAG: proline iminopeptidase-family hydrolase [Methylococcales bacterium]
MKLMFRLFWLFVLFSGCAGTTLKPQEGFVQVPGGPVWYRVIGSGEATPVLMVHGGPGIRSCYFERLAILLGKNRPVILYDQLGTGRSGRPMDSSLWTVDRFVEELATVRDRLGLSRVYLLGHSWGTALVAEYMIAKHPEGIEAAIFVSPYFSSRQWAEDAEILRARLPEAVQQTLLRHERAGTTQSPEYQNAVEVYHDRFLIRSKPSPVESCEEAPRNLEIYHRMWGSTDFRSDGTLQNYDITALLPELKLPVLFVTGRYDTARPETAAKYQAMIPAAALEVLENSAHLGPLEEPMRMGDILEAFFGKVENPVANEASGN